MLVLCPASIEDYKHLIKGKFLKHARPISIFKKKHKNQGINSYTEPYVEMCSECSKFNKSYPLKAQLLYKKKN